ncbi:DUF397 domain-containing protein [Streptomyces sp. NPDC047981]|uniref:DUF397 domain-containing protein n=1 Tax=Streptomyces sp. NPDC047981 TaxID=3154610 RepID=UPI00342924A4
MSEHIISDSSTLSGWRKSSYSGNESGSCVEVLDGHTSGIPVRDSKSPAGPALVFTTVGWTLFVSSLKSGNHLV